MGRLGSLLVVAAVVVLGVAATVDAIVAEAAAHAREARRRARAGAANPTARRSDPAGRGGALPARVSGGRSGASSQELRALRAHVPRPAAATRGRALVPRARRLGAISGSRSTGATIQPGGTLVARGHPRGSELARREHDQRNSPETIAGCAPCLATGRDADLSSASARSSPASRGRPGLEPVVSKADPRRGAPERRGRQSTR